VSDEETTLLDEETEAPQRPRPPAPDANATTFLGKAWNVQHRLERRWDSIGRGRIARVLKMARKPEPDEFRQSALIVLVGIAVIGGIGFFTYLFMSFLLKAITQTTG